MQEENPFQYMEIYSYSLRKNLGQTRSPYEKIQLKNSLFYEGGGKIKFKKITIPTRQEVERGEKGRTNEPGVFNYFIFHT